MEAVSNYEKKRADGESLAALMRALPEKMRDSLMQRIAGMVEGAALVQAEAEKKAG